MKIRMVSTIVGLMIAIGGIVSRSVATFCKRHIVHRNRKRQHVRCETDGEAQIGPRLNAGVRENGF
jgi:hypothetical protein